MTTVFAFILVLGLLIFVHELGHFLLAKATGVRVLKFSLGFGPNRVRSLPDGIAKALDEYLFQQHWEKENVIVTPMPPEQLPIPEVNTPARPIGELCPECGHATLINEEGCRKCYTCGHSEC